MANSPTVELEGSTDPSVSVTKSKTVELEGMTDPSVSVTDGDKNGEGSEDMSVDTKHEGGISVETEHVGLDVPLLIEPIGMCGGDYPIDSTEAKIEINNEEDILKMDLKFFATNQIERLSFISLEVAYLFYTWYGRLNGFSVRRSNVLRSKSSGQVLQQTFVCCREGKRRDNGVAMEDRKRRPKRETRRGCEAKFRVHVHIESGLWYVTVFVDQHNHELLDGMCTSMLPAYRKMTESDVMQMNNYRMAGIGAHHIFSSFAMQSGGYQSVGFRQKDIYNQVGRQRAEHESDCAAALKFLKDLESSDPLMFYRHKSNSEGKLEVLFWSDGMSQIDYQAFGDVVAFDATYGKNKYKFPLVSFCGVNHHSQTIVFATAVVGNEKEETYVWLLQRLMEVMKDKAPTSVITDGDPAMRNAIKVVLPQTHHRLCAWHLSRNANTNVKNPEFTAAFSHCMLTEFGVGKFKKKWTEMVDKFGLHENGWVRDMYEKRKMWAASHIRGNFFAGFRTTSRCEGLNSKIGKFVNSRCSLTELIQHLTRLMNHIRYKEMEADFKSCYGDAVLETQFKELERFGANIFTKEIFSMYREVLQRAGGSIVVGCKETSSQIIFVVTKYPGSGRDWHVSFQPSTNLYKCACKRMESMGIPCHHVLAVLIFLKISELPECLVKLRWTKYAKDGVEKDETVGANSWESVIICRHGALMHHYRELAKLASRSLEDFHEQRDIATKAVQVLRSKSVKCPVGETEEAELDMSYAVPGDPNVVRTKGTGNPGPSSTPGRKKGSRKCSQCHQFGHNKATCNK